MNNVTFNLTSTKNKMKTNRKKCAQAAIYSMKDLTNIIKKQTHCIILLIFLLEIIVGQTHLEQYENDITSEN